MWAIATDPCRLARGPIAALMVLSLAGVLAPANALALTDTGSATCQPLPGMPWLGSFKFVDGELRPCVSEGSGGSAAAGSELTIAGEEIYVESHHPKQPTRPAEHRPCPSFGCLRTDRRPRPGIDRDHFGYPGEGRGAQGAPRMGKDVCLAVHRALRDPFWHGKKKTRLEQLQAKLKDQEEALRLTVRNKAMPRDPRVQLTAEMAKDVERTKQEIKAVENEIALARGAAELSREFDCMNVIHGKKRS